VRIAGSITVPLTITYLRVALSFLIVIRPLRLCPGLKPLRFKQYRRGLITRRCRLCADPIPLAGARLRPFVRPFIISTVGALIGVRMPFLINHQTAGLRISIAVMFFGLPLLDFNRDAVAFMSSAAAEIGTASGLQRPPLQGAITSQSARLLYGQHADR